MTPTDPGLNGIPTCIYFSKCKFFANKGFGLWLTSGSMLACTDCWFERNGREGVYANHVYSKENMLQSMYFERCWFEGNAVDEAALDRRYSIGVFAEPGDITVRDSVFSGVNRAIHFERSKDFLVDNCKVLSPTGGVQFVCEPGTIGKFINWAAINGGFSQRVSGCASPPY